MTSKLEVKAELAIDETGTVTGLAWPFGAPDSVGDTIEKGAFSFPATLPMVLEHDQRTVVGIWEGYAETEAGLEVKGRLFLDGIAPARAAHAELRKGRITGLSLGFKGNGFTPRLAGGRAFNDITVTEISLCRHPVHPGARITAVKANPPEGTSMDPATTETTDDATKLELKAANDNLVKLTARLDKLEAKGNRPVPANDNDALTSEQHTAFLTYLRTGRDETKALTTTSGSAIVAPEDVQTTILEKIAEQSPVRRLATAIRMGGPLLQIPRLVDEVDVGTVTETGTRPEDEPSFEQIDLKPFEMSVIVPVSRIMLEDSAIDLSGYINGHLARRYGQKENTWFINGNGTTQPEGVLTSTEVLTNEVTADELSVDDLIDTFYGIKSGYSQNGAWLMNRQTMATVRKLRDGDGNLIWQSGLSAGQPSLLLGRPVFEAPDMPNVAAEATPIIFGDFATGYLIGDRVDFEFDTDDKTGWGTGIVKLLSRRRLGGRVVLGEALVKLQLGEAA